MRKVKLSKSMRPEDFRNAYFYASELKEFAREIGIKTANFRKFEIEELILSFLETGEVLDTKPALPRQSVKARDNLAPSNQVKEYVGDKRTKLFLLSLIELEAPELKSKSGQWYWLNDWRRKKQAGNETFSYQDLADHLMKLMKTDGRLPQIPSARMNNFITDYNADPTNKSSTRTDVLTAWEQLKRRSGPKTYEEYKKHREK